MAFIQYQISQYKSNIAGFFRKLIKSKTQYFTFTNRFLSKYHNFIIIFFKVGVVAVRCGYNSSFIVQSANYTLFEMFPNYSRYDPLLNINFFFILATRHVIKPALLSTIFHDLRRNSCRQKKNVSPISDTIVLKYLTRGSNCCLKRFWFYSIPKKNK